MRRFLVHLLIIIILGLTFNLNAENIEDDFKKALKATKENDLQEARNLFAKFVRENSDDTRAGEAQYWYAETFRMHKL